MFFCGALLFLNFRFRFRLNGKASSLRYPQGENIR